MAYTKPSDINNLWAQSGTKTPVPTSKRSLGWVAEKPSWQYFNTILNRTDLFNAYINERGITEWDSDTEYLAGKSYIVGSDGKVYQAQLTQTGNDPITDDGTNWQVVFDGNGIAEWNIVKTYPTGSVVTYAGDVWVAQASNTGSEPTPSNTDWSSLAKSGDVESVQTQVNYLDSDISLLQSQVDNHTLELNALGNSSTLDTATSAEITAGTEHKVVTANELSASGFVESKLNASGSAPLYANRAWVNFNGTGTVSIASSGNISSLTDAGTGQYEVNLMEGMPNGYCAMVSNSNNTANGTSFTTDTYLTSVALVSSTKVNVTGFNASSAGYTDMLQVNVVIVG